MPFPARSGGLGAQGLGGPKHQNTTWIPQQCAKPHRIQGTTTLKNIHEGDVVDGIMNSSANRNSSELRTRANSVILRSKSLWDMSTPPSPDTQPRTAIWSIKGSKGPIKGIADHQETQNETHATKDTKNFKNSKNSKSTKNTFKPPRSSQSH